MARALGIPARPVAGLLTDGGRLRYRAWAEVWLGAWVPVDPTLGRFAEAGHIRLLTHATARPTAIVSLLGAIRPTLDTTTTVP
jgi:transglutaminase-like putative cysteine protease